jgi:hypothetical protein
MVIRQRVESPDHRRAIEACPAGLRHRLVIWHIGVRFVRSLCCKNLDECEQQGVSAERIT